MKLIDTQGTEHTYNTLIDHGQSVELDHNLYLQGPLSALTLVPDGLLTVSVDYFRQQFATSEWIAAQALAAGSTDTGKKIAVFLDQVNRSASGTVVLGLPQIAAKITELFNALPTNVVPADQRAVRIASVLGGALAPVAAPAPAPSP